MKTIEQAKEEVKQKNKQNIIAIFRELGIEKVVFEFDGCGDSGQLEDIEVHPSSKEVELKKVQTKMYHADTFYSTDGKWIGEVKEKDGSGADLAEWFAFDALEQAHAGWEINDGSYGEITVHQDGSGSINFNERIMEVENYESSF